jgi:hypothetical protein
VDVERRTADLPVGEWGGKVGSFIATDFRAAFTRLGEVFQARFDVSVEESRELLQDARRDGKPRGALGRSP